MINKLDGETSALCVKCKLKMIQFHALWECRGSTTTMVTNRAMATEDSEGKYRLNTTWMSHARCQVRANHKIAIRMDYIALIID